MTTIRVALLDDQSIVRRGLSAYLNAQPGVRVVGEASSGEEALTLAPQWNAHVVVMDVLMPGGLDGIETTRRLRRAAPGVQVVVLSGYSDDARIVGAPRAGAITYTVKSHAANILRKLGLAHRTQAAVYALRNGWAT